MVLDLHILTHALTHLADKIRHGIDKVNHTCGICVDIQKTFDTVDHHILLKKLEYYGVRGISSKWLSILKYTTFKMTLTFYKFNNCVNSINKQVNSDLGNLSNWLKAHKNLKNVVKTQLVLFSSAKKT